MPAQPAPRAGIDEVMQACGLTEVAGKLIGKLSKGYRQRVGIAQADHPPARRSSSSTSRRSVSIRGRSSTSASLIKSLGGSTTILLSTHILPEVSITCERVIIIDYGRIIAEDTAEGLTRRLQGSHETRARVAGPREAVSADARRRLPGVEEVREEPAIDGVVTVVVRSARGDETRRALAARIVEQRLGSARGATVADEPGGSLRASRPQRAGRRGVKTLRAHPQGAGVLLRRPPGLRRGRRVPARHRVSLLHDARTAT